MGLLTVRPSSDGTPKTWEATSRDARSDPRLRGTISVVLSSEVSVPSLRQSKVEVLKHGLYSLHGPPLPPRRSVDPVSPADPATSVCVLLP